jgi:transposase
MKIEDLPLLTPEKKIELILLQAEQVQLLKEVVKNLKDKIKKLQCKNSNNSHKPPSSDQNRKKKKTQSLRKKSGKNPGGQPGHKGDTLKKVANPDEIIIHSVESCQKCNNKLNKRADNIQSRQVFEIPEPKFIVTEHQVEIKRCRCCNHVNTGEFPEGVINSTQYGEKAKGLIVYLHHGQLLPYKRLKELFQEIYKQNISTGTLVNTINSGADRLVFIENNIKTLLINSQILHNDETGINISGEKQWLHVAGNKTLTHYSVHKKRGFDAMEDIGILSKFKGTMIHDHWKSYFKYTQPNHALCNAHHLRELKYIHEIQGFKWAAEMTDLLLRMRNNRKLAVQNNKSFFPKQTITKYINAYNFVIKKGKTEQAIRGTLDSKNLLKRFEKYSKETLLFIHDFNVPFSNNQGEQDIRMHKVKQKISGGFRTSKGAKAFCTNRGIISTAIKNGKNVLDILQKNFQNILSIEYLTDSS